MLPHPPAKNVSTHLTRKCINHKHYKCMKKITSAGIFPMKDGPVKSILRAMRVTTILLFACVFYSMAEKAYTQNAKVTIRKNNVQVSEVLDEIETQSDYLFIYNDQINVHRKVTVKVKNEPVGNVLHTIFKDTNVGFELEGEHIILSVKEKTDEQEKTIKAIVQQQGMTVTGKVVDENGEPIPGASIVLKGTTTGTISDMDGIYTLAGVPEDAVLVFSFVGMRTQEIDVAGQTNFEIIMEEETLGLDEVVVVGYGIQKKANLSGAVSQVSAKSIESRPVTSIGQSLQGLVPNLNITSSSGQSNVAPSFNIRGFTSINGGEPLILIDNVPVSAGELSRYNPNDIESISVLKDAASSAIYGGRAAYGVVLVTTKKGDSETLKVSVNSYVTARTLGRKPEIVTDPYEVASFKHEMAKPWYNLYPDESLAYAKQVSEGLAPSSRLNPENPTSYQYYGSTDWFAELYENYSPSYTGNFNISQRTEKINYYLSGESFGQKGMMKYGNDKYDRHNLRSKVELKLTDWLKVSNNTSYSSTKYEEPMYGGWLYFHNVNRTSTLDIPRNEDGTWTSKGADMMGRLQEGGRKEGFNKTFNTSFGFDLELLKDELNVRGDINLVRTGYDSDAWDGPVTYYSGPNKTGIAGPATSYAYQENVNSRYNVLNVFFDYKKTFGDHYLNALVGYNQEENYYNSWWAQRKNLISTSLPAMNLATGEKDLGTSVSTWALRGAFFRLNYIFKERYILEGNGRYDGTSRFPKDDRFGFFPSVSGAWILSNESFFHDFNENVLNSTISQLKLRASYGTLGNQSVGDYEYIATMGSGKSGWIIGDDRPTYVSYPGLVSPTLTWEEVRQYNFGVDLGLLKEQFTVGFDIYNRQTLDMLTKGQTLPSVLGTGVPRENAADLETKGWDLSVVWRDNFNLANKPFNYSARFIISDSQSEITRFSNPTKGLGDYYEGYKIGTIWGYRTDGFFIDDADVAANADSHRKVASYIGTRPIAPGDIKFKDLNNDGIIDRGDNTLDNPGDQVIIGNSTNRYPFSVDLSADWNGFDLRLFVQGIGKKDYFPGAGHHYFWGVFAQPWANILKTNLNHWTPETPDAYFPRPKSYVAEQSWVEVAAPNDRYLQNAAYGRLKNLTLGYTLPSTLTQKVKIDRFRIYLSGENLWEYTKLDKNLDPEGLSGTIYPFQRVYSIGINLNF